MGLKLREAISKGGPDGGSSWIDAGDSFTLQNHASIVASTTLANFPMQIVTQPDKQLAGGDYPGDSLVSSTGISGGTGPIQRFGGAQMTLAAVLAPASTLTLAIRIMRALGTLGAQIAAAGGALTSLPLANPLVTAMPSGQTFVLTNAAGTTQTWTTSAAVAVGANSVPVNSQTPNGTYAAGVAMVGQVGNAPAFGWLNGGGGGTPAFAADNSIVFPPLTNPQIITPGNSGSYVLLYPGDTPELILQTSGGTVTIPVGAIQPFMV